MVAALGTWGAQRRDPFQSKVCIGQEGMRFRESVISEYRSRRGTLSISQDIHRPSSRHLPSASASGFGDIAGKGCDVNAEGTSVQLRAAQTCGARSQAERLAMESPDRVRRKWARRATNKVFLLLKLDNMGRASACLRGVAKGADTELVRALAPVRKFFRKTERLTVSPSQKYVT